MFGKTTIAVGAIAVAAMAFDAAPAQADGITFSFGSNGSVGVTIGGNNQNTRGVGGRLSCGEVESILYYDHDFRNIQPIDCNGSSYKYNALHYGNPVRVRADAHTGNIIRVRPR